VKTPATVTNQLPHHRIGIAQNRVGDLIAHQAGIPLQAHQKVDFLTLAHASGIVLHLGDRFALEGGNLGQGALLAMGSLSRRHGFVQGLQQARSVNGVGGGGAPTASDQDPQTGAKVVGRHQLLGHAILDADGGTAVVNDAQVRELHPPFDPLLDDFLH
jgi:hypothetical protein